LAAPSRLFATAAGGGAEAAAPSLSQPLKRRGAEFPTLVSLILKAGRDIWK
jgi:hypothetical protein